MSVAVQVVNGREQGAEEEELQEAGSGSQEVQEAGEGTQETGGEAQEIAGAQAMETKMEVEPVVPSSPKEEVLSDSELDHSGAPKKKKFKAWKSIKKIFKKKKSSKGSEGDSVPSKSKSKSTSELETGGDEEGELNKRISMSEDSVFTPDKPASAKDRSSYSLNTSNLTDEISAKLKERASSSDDGYAQSSEDAMTTGDTTHDNSYVAPSDSSKTDSGIITTEDESHVMSKPAISNRRWKSFTSVGVKDSHHVTSDMKRLKTENPGDVDLDLIKTSNLLSSSAAKHRISVAPSNRRPSRKARAWTPEKRSSSRLDDAPTPIAEEPTTPTKSPVPLDLDSELPFPGVALTTSPAPKQHSNGSSSIKPKANKGLGPMVLPPILPPFGPKGTGSRSRKVESTPATTDSQSTNLDIASDSATFPIKEDQSVSKTSKVDLIENQKNGKDVVKEKGRHEDIEKLLEVDPALFGDDIKLREDDSTKKLEGNKEDSKMTSKGEDGGLGLVDSGTAEQDDGGVGVGLGIADLDLLVDLPDPLDLGKNMFGVETIVEEDEEEEEAGEEMEGSDDFLEEDSSMEDVEEVTVEKVESKNSKIEEEKVKGKVAALVNKAEEEKVKEGKVTTMVDKDEDEKIKVGTVAAMISEVEEEIRKSPPGERRGKGKETAMMKKKTEEEKDKETGRKDDVEIRKKDKLVSSVNKEESSMPSTLAAKREMADHVAMDTDTTHDKDDDNDNNLNDSNYPGIVGRLPSEDSVKGTVKLSREDEEKGDTPKKEAVPVVIIESPSSDDLKTSKDTTLEDGAEEEEEEDEPIVLPQVPKEVIIIMKDGPKKDDLAKKEEEKEAKPSTPTTPEAPTQVEMPSLEEDAAPASPSPPPAEMKKKEEVEKESAETEKDVEEVKKKEEEDPSIVEERRLSVAASKALFEAKIPASEPYKSSNKAMVNGTGTPKTDTRRASAPIEPVPETKAEADTKLSEKEEKKEETGEKDEADKEEAKEEPVSLKDRISRYQNLATNSSVKGLTAHVPTRNSPTKQRPQSTSNIENKDSPKKLAPKVLSKPSSTSSSKPSGSTAMTTEHSNPSTNLPPSSTTTTSSPRKPLQPKIDRCMVCQKAVYPNEMSKFEGRVFHRTCQKCSECSRTLTLWNLDIAGDQLYCKQHGTVVKNNQLKEELIIS